MTLLAGNDDVGVTFSEITAATTELPQASAHCLHFVLLNLMTTIEVGWCKFKPVEMLRPPGALLSLLSPLSSSSLSSLFLYLVSLSSLSPLFNLHILSLSAFTTKI